MLIAEVTFLVSVTMGMGHLSGWVPAAPVSGSQRPQRPLTSHFSFAGGRTFPLFHVYLGLVKGSSLRTTLDKIDPIC